LRLERLHVAEQECLSARRVTELRDPELGAGLRRTVDPAPGIAEQHPGLRDQWDPRARGDRSLHAEQPLGYGPVADDDAIPQVAHFEEIAGTRVVITKRAPSPAAARCRCQIVHRKRGGRWSAGSHRRRPEGGGSVGKSALPRIFTWPSDT